MIRACIHIAQAFNLSNKHGLTLKPMVKSEPLTYDIFIVFHCTFTIVAAIWHIQLCQLEIVPLLNKHYLLRVFELRKIP